MLKRFLILVFTLAVGLILVGCGSFSLAADVTPPPGAQSAPVQQLTSPSKGTSTQSSTNIAYPLLPPDPVQGQAIYIEKCLPCHGPTGNGDGPQAGGLPVAPAAIGSADIARASRPVDWFQVVSQGKIDQYMPGFQGSLSERQRWDVLAYVYSLSTSKDELDAGKKVYTTQQCAACHGDTGKGDGAKAAGQNVPDWSQQERLANLSAQEMETVIAQGKNSMPAYSQLSENERWAVTNYVRSLTFQEPGEVAAAATTLTPAAQTAASTNSAERSVAIRGKILDAKGQPAKDGLNVSLFSFQGMTQVGNVTTTSNPDGTYEFKDVKVNADSAFVVQVVANQYPFNSDILQGKDITGDAVELPVTLYDTSTDPSPISADRMHVFFDFSKPGLVQVVELFILSNPSGKLIVPASATQPVLSFTLPANATNLQFENGAIGDRFVKTAQGFGDLSPVQPGAGQHQVLFSYDLPYEQKLDLSIPLALNVGTAMVMVPDGGPTLSSDQLQSAGVRDAQGVTFQLYSSAAMNAGSTLKMSLSGKAQNSTQSEGGDMTNLAIGLGAFGVVVAGAGVWVFRTRKKETQGLLKALPIVETELESEEALLDAILALEDQYQAGELSEDAFKLRRAELKERLLRAHDGEKRTSQ